MLGRDLLLEAFRQYGVEYLFGNPGTTELPLLDGLVNYPDIKYILGLHEDIAVGMALGYAQATGKPGVVNLHVAPGVGHGVGNMIEAYRSSTPLIVTAGQQDLRGAAQELPLWGDTVAMVKDFTKWSWEVTRVEEIPLVIHRAFKEALTEPKGPVFISLPADVLWQETDRSVWPLTQIAQSFSGEEEAVNRAAQKLLKAQNPVLIIGDRVANTDSVDACIQLAEKLGCAVYQEPMGSKFNFPRAHPQYLGSLAPNGAVIEKALQEYDVIVLMGVSTQAPLTYSDKPFVPPGSHVIAVDLSTWQLGKNFAVHEAILGHPGQVAKAWLNWINQHATEEDEQRFAKSKEVLSARKQQAEALKKQQLESVKGKQPLNVNILMDALNQYWNEACILVDESITSSRALFAHLNLTKKNSRFGLKYGGLGFGLAAAAGVQLGRPQERVVAVVGDGSALYYIQALWNAARYDLPIIYIIPNNTSYKILKDGMLNLGSISAKARAFPGMDLDSPVPDMARIAEGFGLRGINIETEEQLHQALQEAFGNRKPYLLNVRIDGSV